MKYELTNCFEPWGLVDPFFDDLFAPSRRSAPRRSMETDIEDKGDHYLMSVNLPGFDKKEISMDVEDGYLTIRAKKEENTENKEKNNYVHKERFYGSMSRSFYLGDVDETKISATFENGVLAVTLPKVKEEDVSKKRAITIG